MKIPQLTNVIMFVSGLRKTKRYSNANASSCCVVCIEEADATDYHCITIHDADDEDNQVRCGVACDLCRLRCVDT